MVSITIRPAIPEECGLLSALALRSKAHWGYSETFMEACRAELAISEDDIRNPQRHTLLAESEGQVLGYYALERLSAEEYELDALFVEPRHIGQGIGKKLIEHAKLLARQHGGQSLLIQGDPNARNFYLAAGSVLIGERESGSIPGRYLPMFRIPLD